MPHEGVYFTYVEINPVNLKCIKWLYCTNHVLCKDKCCVSYGIQFRHIYVIMPLNCSFQCDIYDSNVYNSCLHTETHQTSVWIRVFECVMSKTLALPLLNGVYLKTLYPFWGKRNSTSHHASSSALLPITWFTDYNWFGACWHR